MCIFSDPLLVISFGFFISLTFIIILAMSFYDPMRKKIKEIGGKINRKGAGVFAVDGRDVAIEYFRGSRGSSPWFKISTSGTFGDELVIRPETSRDEFYKKVGLNTEVQVSDKEIDEELFFECDNPEFTKQLFFNADVKPLVLEILSYFSSIAITHTTCTLIRCPCEALDKISNEVIMDSARKLLTFVSSIPRSISNFRPEVFSFKTWRTVLHFIGYGILTCGVICAVWALCSFRVVDFARAWFLSITVCVPLCAGAFYFAFQKIKGFSTSSKVLIHFLFSFGIGMLLLVRYGGAVANGIFDKSPLQKFEQTVINKYTTTHKSTTTYHVVVASWHSASREWAFTVGRGEYNRIRVGKTHYMIATKSGRFGFEWVISELYMQ